MIETADLTRRFGEVTAVEGLDLRIGDGQVFGFLGPNGAGKTTTVRMLCCLIGSTSGSAYIDGLDIRDREDCLRIRERIGLLPETPGLYESLSAHRNLEFYAKLHGVSGTEGERRIRDLLRTLGIWDRREDPVAKFSKGMKQKLAIARALIHDPEYLFLDEPTSGLDPQASLTVRNYLLDLREEGRTIFLNTHNLDDAERLCDTIGVLNTRLLDLGGPEELTRKFYGRTTLVHMAEVHEGMVDLVSSLPGVREVRHQGSRLMIDVVDPEAANPRIVSELVGAGARVVSVEEVRHGLEDVYLRLIEGSS
ncbi:MAG: ABC transporter ATP-binding protein [Methanomassiliicoccales archaeon]